MQFYYQNLYVSSFYASWGETLETLWRGALLEAAPKATAATPAFAIPTACDTNTKPPHIILIHQESVVQPSLFKQLSYDHAVDPLFLSADSNLHQMRVETYGGASWLTEFSLLAGVSTHSFGGMRQFVQTFTQNKLKDTLPQALERCGYRNVVFYPMMRNFVSNDKFYTSIGLREIFDMKSQGRRDRPGARPLLLRQLAGRDGPPYPGVAASRCSFSSRPCRRTGRTTSPSARR